MTIPPVHRRVGSVIAFVVLVALVTASARAHLGLSVGELASSPERIARGKLWLLLTSALVLDHPIMLSLVSFAALASLAMLVCSPRVFWRAALLGHVASTLLVYLFVAVSRLLDPSIFAYALGRPDYGVSAISSAWLAAIATVLWRIGAGGRPGKVGVIAGCAAVGLFAYSIRPDVTVISSEHLVAFAVGIGTALPRRSWAKTATRLRRNWSGWLPRFRRTAAVAVAASAAVLAAGVGGGAALAALEEIVVPDRPSVADCVRAWDSSASAAVRRGFAGGRFAGASVTVARRAGATPGQVRVVCRFVFSGAPNRVATVDAAWRRGRIVGAAAVAGSAAKPGAALVVGANGLVRLARGGDSPLFDLRFMLGWRSGRIQSRQSTWSVGYDTVTLWPRALCASLPTW
jgi:hypothetical protein